MIKFLDRSRSFSFPGLRNAQYDASSPWKQNPKTETSPQKRNRGKKTEKKSKTHTLSLTHAYKALSHYANIFGGGLAILPNFRFLRYLPISRFTYLIVRSRFRICEVIERQRDRERQRETDRERQRQRERQTNRQTKRDKERERERERETLEHIGIMGSVEIKTMLVFNLQRSEDRISVAFFLLPMPRTRIHRVRSATLRES